jgi:hypothetical protein
LSKYDLSLVFEKYGDKIIEKEKEESQKQKSENLSKLNKFKK